MVRRAIVPGAVATALAGGIGAAAGGAGVGWSAAIGIALAVANFAAAGFSLAWAAGISLPALQIVALGGFVVRLGVILGIMFALATFGWFSRLAFGLAVVPGTFVLLGFESILMLRGLGQRLVIPSVQPDSAGARAGAPGRGA